MSRACRFSFFAQLIALFAQARAALAFAALVIFALLSAAAPASAGEAEFNAGLARLAADSYAETEKAIGEIAGSAAPPPPRYIGAPPNRQKGGGRGREKF